LPDPTWQDDPLEVAVREFCYGHSRAVPRSVFLGRTVARGEPQWLPEDTEAALEWQTYQNSLCPGCRRPRHESFAVEMDDHYDVTVLQCHACAARDRKAYNTRPEQGEDPQFGRFFVVTPEAADGDVQIAG
jgi:predicted Fe-S protein YdhL (DUF1289 family)